MPSQVPPPPYGALTEQNQPVFAWLNWFNIIARYVARSPVINQAIIAPAVAPNKVGDIYVDTATGKVYIATGNTNAGDWKILN